MAQQLRGDSLKELSTMSLSQKSLHEPSDSTQFLADAIEFLPQVEHITREIFGPRFFSAITEDVEVVGDRHIEFSVVDDDESDHAVLARNDAWHRGVAELPVNVRSLFRLSIKSVE